jgi:germination protein M
MKLVRSVTAFVCVMGLAFTACGGGTTPGAGGNSTPPANETENREPGENGNNDEPTPPADEEMSYEVWFQRGEFLYPAARTGPKTVRVGTVAVEALLDGPGQDEAALDVASSIPKGTELLDLAVSEGVATANLSGEYETGGGSFSMRMRLAQLVYTLTQFPTVAGVSLELDGEPVEVFSGEGIVIDKPLTRADYEDLLSPIIVDEPQAGASVTSPVTIEGSANVFEATVTIRIVTNDGEQLVETFTTATCGTGCRGDYSVDVDFKVDERTAATIEVFESSAEDGSPLHTVSVPVTLLP